MNESMKNVYNNNIQNIPKKKKKNFKVKSMHGRVMLRNQKRRY